MNLQNSSAVGANNPEDFVRATLSYSAVPEPTGISLLLAAMVFGLRFSADRR